jgi:hypothetical protein
MIVPINNYGILMQLFRSILHPYLLSKKDILPNLQRFYGFLLDFVKDSAPENSEGSIKKHTSHTNL